MLLSLFDKFTIKNVTLKNRVVLSPMCQYKALNKKGDLEDWHFVHYGSRAVGGTGLIMLEMTNIEPNGRITENCLGLYTQEHEEKFKKLNKFIHECNAKVGIQISHAGRKSRLKKDVVGPSSIPFAKNYVIPRELKYDEIKTIIEKFAISTRRAVKSGFDIVEIQGGHGYLFHQFLSSISNIRKDVYGDPLTFPLEVIEAVKSELPCNVPLFLRVSAIEDSVGGYNFDQLMNFCNAFVGKGVDLIDVSSGADSPIKSKTYPGHRLDYSKMIRNTLNIPTMSVGEMYLPELADYAVKEKYADLISIGRGMLRNPYWAMDAASKLNKTVILPGVYEKGII